MNLIPSDDGTGSVIVSLGAEEAVILLQAEKMVRTVIDRCPDWTAGARFLTSPGGQDGVLALIPRAAAAAVLQAPATHEAERDLQILLFDFQPPTDSSDPNPSHGSFPNPTVLP